MSTLPAGQYCWGADTGDIDLSATTTTGDLTYDVASSDTMSWNFADSDLYSFSTSPVFKKNVIQFNGLKKDNGKLTYHSEGSYWSKELLTPKDHMDSIVREYNKHYRQTIYFNGLKREIKKKIRSVLFTPSVAFGLCAGRDITLEAQRQKERNKFKPIIYITAKKGIKTIKVHGVEIIPTQRPTITIRLKGKKVGVIELVNGSKIYTVTDEEEYRHVTGHSTKLLTWDYSPWTSNNDMNGNDLTDIGNIRFNNTDEIKWREWRPRPCINIRSKNSGGTIRFANDGDILFCNQGTENAPMDMISATNRAYALKSIADESKAVAGGIFDDYSYDFEDDDNLRISFSGSNLAGSIPTTSNLMIDTDSIGVWAGKKRRHTINISLKGKKEDYEDEDEDEYCY